MTKRRWVPHPESWEDVAIEEVEETPQLDLFTNPIATRLSVPHNQRTETREGQ